MDVVLRFSEKAYFGADGSGDQEKDVFKSAYPIGDMPTTPNFFPKNPPFLPLSLPLIPYRLPQTRKNLSLGQLIAQQGEAEVRKKLPKWGSRGGWQFNRFRCQNSAIRQIDGVKTL